jgi:hypothetical protein
MATPAPAVQPGDVWGQTLLDHITSKHVDTLASAATTAQTKADAAQAAAVTAAQTYVNNKVGASTLVLGPSDIVPANTPAGTVIFRTT